MELSIISINHKKPFQAKESMASLWNHYSEEFKNGEFEYIIVDNFSEDESIEVLKNEVKKYKNFKLVENTKDSGFGEGNNLGVKNASGEYLLFLNDDTVIEDTGLLKMLSYIKNHSEVGALGGKIMNFDGTEQASIGKFYSILTVTFFILGLQRLGLIDKNPREIKKVDWIKGALFMIKKDVFEKVGGFDKKIWMYTEDMEICYRIKKMGLSCVYFPDIRIKHKNQGSTNRSFAIVNIYKNLPYFYKKHKSILEYYYVKFILCIKALTLIFIGKILGNNYLYQTYFQAIKTLK